MNLLLRARILSAVIALSLAGLACGSGIGIGAPTAPASPIPISTEAAGELEDLWQTALNNPGPNGEVTVVMTEEQVTSYVALKMAEEPDNPLTNIQIFLRDGKMTLKGDAKLGAITAPASVNALRSAAVRTKMCRPITSSRRISSRDGRVSPRAARRSTTTNAAPIPA